MSKSDDNCVFIVYPTEYKPISYIQDYLIYDDKRSTFLLSNPFYDLPNTPVINIYKHISDIPFTPKTTNPQPPKEQSALEQSNFNIDDFATEFGLEPAETSLTVGGGRTAFTNEPPTLANLRDRKFTQLISPKLYFNKGDSNITNNFTIAYGILNEQKKLTKKAYIIRAPFSAEAFSRSSIKCSLTPSDVHKVDMYLTLLEHQTLFVSELMQLALLFQVDITTLTNSNYRSSVYSLANNEFVSAIVSEINRKLSRISESLPHISVPEQYLNSFINPPTYLRTSSGIIRANTVYDTEDAYLTPLEQLSKSIIKLNYQSDKDIKTLAKRLHNTNTHYNSTYTLTLAEFQTMWLVFYSNAMQDYNYLRPSNRLVLYSRQNLVTGTTSPNKWLSIPINFNTKASRSAPKTFRHKTADKLEQITSKTVAELFRVDLSTPELYNSRKFYFCEGCIYLRPHFRLLYGQSCYPSIVWNVDKYILVRQRSNESSRIYNDVETISELFNESPKLTSLK